MYPAMGATGAAGPYGQPRRPDLTGPATGSETIALGVDLHDGVFGNVLGNNEG